MAHGVCAGLYEEALLQARIVISEPILLELREKLITKAKLQAEEAELVISAVAKDAEIFSLGPLSSPVCRDPDDDMVLATALAADANAIVTGDKDLLVLQMFEGIPIFSPRECLAFLHKM